MSQAATSTSRTSTRRGRRAVVLLLALVVALAELVLAPSALAAPPGNIDPGATAGDQSVVLTITPPDDGGSPITSYQIIRTPDGGASNTSVVPAEDFTDSGFGDGSLSYTVTGLSNGTNYTFCVGAQNKDGTGTCNFPAAAIPDALPAAPTNVVAVASVSTDPSVAGNATADVSFDAVSGNGGTEPTATTFYTVTSSDGALSATCDAATPGPCQVTGLSNGTAYAFTVTANNNAGSSVSSDPSNTVIPVGAPYAPTALSRVGANPRSATISFVPPRSSGSPVTAYQLSVDGGATWRTASTRTSGGRRVITAPSLRSGTRYALAVRAVNRINGASRVGVRSAPITVLTGPSILPGRPNVRAGTSAVLVYWPASREPDVTGYTVYSSRGAACTTQARTETYCIVGARAGLRTTFRIVARSAAGVSYLSAASRTVVVRAPSLPRRAPGVPHGFSAHPKTVKASKKATLQAPGFLPGSTVTVVAYGKKRHVLRSVVASSRGVARVSFRAPRDKARRLLFVAFGVTPDSTAKAVGVSIKKRGRR